jgi:protein phosphatase
MSAQADTVEMPALHGEHEINDAGAASADVQVDLAARSHQGHVRSSNEDHFLIIRFGRSLETLRTSLPADTVPARSAEVGYGLFVADGMGGHHAGEVASRTAITTLVGLVLRTPDWILSSNPQDAEQLIERMAARFRHIDAALREEGRDNPRLMGMGTTMTLACSFGSRLVIGHVGDSRAYLLRGGELFQLTRDHTVVQGLLDAGVLTPEEAALHPARHLLTRSLGACEDNCEADFHTAILADGDDLLLCSDGLTNMVDDASITRVLRTTPSADEACEALVTLALDSGGKDNVTVALARYRFPRQEDRGVAHD